MSGCPYQDSDVIRAVLDLKNVAIVDLSADELRASNFVGFYLGYHGYRVIPVNPWAAEILDLPCYPTLGDIPEPVDLVNVFRLPEAVPSITRDAVTIGVKCLWLQFGVISQ